jgi:hypothetical protein
MTPQLLDALRQGRPLLPLSVGQAAAQAYRIRVKHDLPYGAIARVMGEYHGIWKGEQYWRRHCRSLGAPMKRPGQTTPTQHKQAKAA